MFNLANSPGAAHVQRLDAKRKGWGIQLETEIACLPITEPGVCHYSISGQVRARASRRYRSSWTCSTAPVPLNNRFLLQFVTALAPSIRILPEA